MTVLTWSDDRVEQLKKLWEAGLSASQIAAELGNVTRNAVIGKVHRLGLSGRAKSPSSAAPRQRKARPAQHMMRVARPVSRGNTALAHAFEVELEPDPIAYRQRGADEPAAVAAGIERGHLPLAGRRSLEPGILLLRRQGADRPALLRPSLADRLSARLRPPPSAAEADAVAAFSGTCRPRLVRNCARGAGTHMWTAPVPQEFFWSDRIACIHMSGLLMRSVGPLAKMVSATRVPNTPATSYGPMGPTECLAPWIDRSYHLLLLQLRLGRSGELADRPISYAASADAPGIRAPS